ncbi:hypothetical protein JOF28_002757 [Leucobacter exalbidus]|uniref:Choice-of-anchor A family protein n=1 Tax=Leucobacter exalbidus TaxID=662960 RepID=A0A940T262_9MICO|nr:hypothetical protein [Leucobacter exalbidus]MBP1327525.1 hypothetical protein [Leucobacter exalbidus]
MASSPRPRALSASWKRALSGAGAFTLIAGSLVAGGSTAAVAAPAPTTFNPFEINNGFTVVSQGDVMLGNGEIEGSVAAYGGL